MAITYKDSSGMTRKVESVVFNGVAIKKLQYDSGNGQTRLVWCKPYTLSVQKGIGVSSIEVRRTASQEPSASTGVLSNGSTIYYGDTLSVSAVAQTGYALNAYTRTYTVTDNVAINISATLNHYTLSISQGTGVASVTVTRTSSPNQGAATGVLSNGATIYYGDKLSVSATPSVGYNLNGYTSSYTVSGNVSVSVTAYVKSFVLTIPNNPTGVSSVTVKRTASPYKNAATGTLANGSAIYYGDTLSVSASSVYGYTLNGYTSSYTVTGNVTVNVTARVSSYTLNISKDGGISSVNVTRTSSPRQGASIGPLNNGATIYYGDTLTVKAIAYLGYEPNNYTESYTVSGNVNINITSKTTLPMVAPSISGSMKHDSSSNAFYVTLYITNPNNIDVTADVTVEDYYSSVVETGSVSLSKKETKQYIVGEMYTTKVNARVTLRCSGYTPATASQLIEGSFNNNSSSGSGSGSGSTSSGQS